MPQRYASLDELVRDLGGSRTLRRVLVANNGVAAVKGIRSLRAWAYETLGNEHALVLVAMVTPEDVRANAEYIRLADQFVEVPGGPNHCNYANVDLIVEVAQSLHVDAVWPGWGHASENPLLPAALARCQPEIAFIGPNSTAMRDLGDKVTSSIIAQSVQVRMLPWSGDGLRVQYQEHGVSDEIVQQACILSLADALERAPKIGFPLMVKASAGGGGKGIRRSNSLDDIGDAYRQVANEVAGSPIFLMKLAPHARHIEVQLLGDMYGNVIALSGRDCSVQRRHQKIIEEGPPVIVPEETWECMQRDAVRLAREVGYYGAGTAEFLFFDDTYCFLEINPRLQVEHPVTERITGVNLPSCQLLVAMGVPLYRIPSIRNAFGFEPNESSVIDFEAAGLLRPREHCVAVRITAENPDDGFKPTTGSINELAFRDTPDVWGYFSMKSWGVVHEFADSQIGHLFAKGEDRERARRNLVLALKGVSIDGDIRTTKEYLVDLLENETFVNNRFDNNWLDHLIATRVRAPRPPVILSVICAATFRAVSTIDASRKQHCEMLERGQIPSASLIQGEIPLEFIIDNVKFMLRARQVAADRLVMTMNGSTAELTFRRLRDGGLLVGLEGSHTVYGKEEALGLRVQVDGQTCMCTKDVDPTRLTAPMPGRLVRYLIDDGASVGANAAYAEVEVMKMYMPLLCSLPGRITFAKPIGSVLETGDLIARLELADPREVRRAALHTDALPLFSRPVSTYSSKSHQRLQIAIDAAKAVLDGFDATSEWDSDVGRLVEDLDSGLHDFKVPLLHLEQTLSTIRSRLPAGLLASVDDVVAELRSSIVASQTQSLDRLLSVIKEYRDSLSTGEAALFGSTVQPLVDLCERFHLGLSGFRLHTLRGLLQQFIRIEREFDRAEARRARRDEVILLWRSELRNDLDAVYDVLRSHQGLPLKIRLLEQVLDVIEAEEFASYVALLEELSEFSSAPYSSLVLKVRRILVRHSKPSSSERRGSIEALLHSAIESMSSRERDRALAGIVDDPNPLLELLLELTGHREEPIAMAALELYVRRAYRSYDVTSVACDPTNARTLRWSFALRPQRVSAPLVPVHVDSFDDLRALDNSPLIERQGVAVLAHSVQDVASALDTAGGLQVPSMNGSVLDTPNIDMPPLAEEEPGTPRESAPTDDSSSGNVLFLVLRGEPCLLSDAELLRQLTDAIGMRKSALNASFIRRVTIAAISDSSNSTRIFTFRHRLGFKEDTLYRNVDPPLAFQLELKRLSNYQVTLYSAPNPELHVYYACCQRSGLHRFFVRCLVRQVELQNRTPSSHLEVALREATDALSVAMSEPQYKRAVRNHIFINVVRLCHEPLSALRATFASLISPLTPVLNRLFVSTVNIKVTTAPHASTPKRSYRFIFDNPSRLVFRLYSYLEMPEGRRVLLRSLDDTPGPDENVDVSEAHAPLDKRDTKRLSTNALSTTFVHDFLDLFYQAVEQQWSQARHLSTPTGSLVRAVQLQLPTDTSDDLIEVPATRDSRIGMLAWRLTLCTPEAPSGRPLVVLANDITHINGSFGVDEDHFFTVVSRMCRHRGLPRLYLSANSGARIGLSREVKEAFGVEWLDPSDPLKGFHCLTLPASAPADIASVVRTRPRGDALEITDVLGREHGLGVENLKGSAAIAAETSRAYDETFTLSYVTGRSVGIGAYVVRLGQRTIQAQAPLILTGATALNRLLGQDVYTSNLQIGGPRIMFGNGVSHMTVPDDREGITSCVRWLSYVPLQRGLPPPMLESLDSPSRPIRACPTREPHDPRNWLAGAMDPTSETPAFMHGFFDEGSVMETLHGWGRTVVTGRARLGGIPVGFIAVETRTVEKVEPADPAMPDSHETVLQQAGQVWYPDSAYKTAQTIRDLNREELPLFIFANWRGFSGGMRDMFGEVLKFGAFIVDALVEYRHPIEIYLVPHSELRGGAWVVVDPSINPDVMEMYAEPNSRGGILEPTGTVEIKFREPDLVRTMHRLDDELIHIDSELKTCASEETAALRARAHARESSLLPIYRQIAVTFADLHDTPARMAHVGAIRGVVEWAGAREFFFNRIRRRLREFALVRRIMATSQFSFAKSRRLLTQWFTTRSADDSLIANEAGSPPRISELLAASALHVSSREDVEFCDWLDSSAGEIEHLLRQTTTQEVTRQSMELARRDTQALVDGLILHLQDGNADPVTLELLARVKTMVRSDVHVVPPPAVAPVELVAAAVQAADDDVDGDDAEQATVLAVSALP